MAEPNPYSLGRPAADEYNDLKEPREGVLEKARELAAISIPKLYPPDSYKPGDRLSPPNQSHNSRCLNSLASKLMLTSVPPGKPILKFNILEHKLQAEIDEEPQLFSALDQGLQRREEAHRKRLESTNIRSSLTLAYKKLLGGGNVLWQHTNINKPVVHSMEKYVVRRDNEGTPIVTILLEPMRLADLQGPDRQFVRQVQVQRGITPKTGRMEDEIVDIYTVQRWDDMDQVHYYWQEYEGQMLPDSDLEIDADDAPPLYAAWLIPQFGHHWGGSYSEEYEGDMFIVENSNGSLNDGSEFASLLLLFLRAGAATSKRSIEQARNGKVLTGNAEDLTAFSLDKARDFQFVENHTMRAEQRMSAAWLLMSSIQRDAERVTAEEWRILASELDGAMGGLYSEIAQNFQRHVIRRFVALHEDEDNKIPPLPKEVVSVAVVTGLDALGRGTELEGLVTGGKIIKEMFGEQAAAAIEPEEFNRRVWTAVGVKADGLVRTKAQMDETAAAGEQKALQANMIDKATAPIAQAAAGGIADVAVPAIQQQMQQGA